MASKTIATFLLCVSLVSAQVGTARLDGTVVDESGAVIPGAKVEVVDQKTKTKVSTLTNGDGNFVFPSLQPSTYEASAEAKGFRTSVVSNLELNVAVTITPTFQAGSGSSGGKGSGGG